MQRMTDLRTAAQQALEALDGLSEDAVCQSSHHAKKDHHTSLDVCPMFLRLRAAITALRAALAEPVQEPVAKVKLMTTGGNAGLATRIVEIDDHLRERLRPGQLLYTAPPQRNPLTPSSPCEMTPAERKMFKLGWLECEAAHGIKEKK